MRFRVQTTGRPGIPACFLSEIIAFAENLGRWGLESEVTTSRAGTGNNYFDSPLSLPGLRVTFVEAWLNAELGFR